MFLPAGSTPTAQPFSANVETHEQKILREAQMAAELQAAVRQFLLGTGRMDDIDSINPIYRMIMVANFTSYCKTVDQNPDQLIPAEFAVGAFSVGEGVRASVGNLIDAGAVPVGMRADALEMSRSLGVPMMGKHGAAGATTAMSPANVLSVFDLWCDDFAFELDGAAAFFVERSNIPVAERCLNWLVMQSGTSEGAKRSYRVVPLDVVAVELAVLTAELFDVPGRVLDEGMASRIISHFQFAFAPEIGCDWHSQDEKSNKIDYCCKNVVLRQIYNLLAYYCPTYDIVKIPGKHEPILEKTEVVDHWLSKLFKEMELSRVSQPEVGRIIDQE